MKQLTTKQKELLEIIQEDPHGHSTLEMAAFLMQTTPQGIGLIMRGLSKRAYAWKNWHGETELWLTEK